MASENHHLRLSSSRFNHRDSSGAVLINQANQIGTLRVAGEVPIDHLHSGGIFLRSNNSQPSSEQVEQFDGHPGFLGQGEADESVIAHWIGIKRQELCVGRDIHRLFPRIALFNDDRERLNLIRFEGAHLSRWAHNMVGQTGVIRRDRSRFS